MAYRSSSAALGTNTTSPIDAGKPAGFASNDILIAVFQGSTGSATPGLTMGSGWTQLFQRRDVPGCIAAWWALGSVATTDISITTGNFTGQHSIHAFTGRHQTVPITANDTVLYSGGDANAYAPAVTAASADDLLVGYLCASAIDITTAATYAAAPAGFADITNITHIIGNFPSRIITCYDENVASGSTGNINRGSGSGTNFFDRHGWTIAIAAVGGGGGGGSPTVRRLLGGMF